MGSHRHSQRITFLSWVSILMLCPYKSYGGGVHGSYLGHISRSLDCFTSNFSKNGVWCGKSYYRLLIGNHTLAFDWCHFWWSWSTFEGHFSLGCHFHVHFSNPWHAFASHGLPAIAELLITYWANKWWCWWWWCNALTPAHTVFINNVTSNCAINKQTDHHRWNWTNNRHQGSFNDDINSYMALQRITYAESSGRQYADSLESAGFGGRGTKPLYKWHMKKYYNTKCMQWQTSMPCLRACALV